ncbi:hypothetical protein UUU_25950 [Klebsiella pneumoniae subsp. pneumoniae DSM 30104 = JCM 1662 = NBRC 14940]|nr:hypothetical protein UUU_25950 [Klebsiella pneumoniae subsp. pneumoniae DSM 30104 = JCM 1662 = NBRC 14940]
MVKTSTELVLKLEQKAVMSAMLGVAAILDPDVVLLMFL